MKKLTIDWSELIFAFDQSFTEINYYLDTETGQILLVLAETRSQLESIYEAHFDPNAPDDFDLAAALSEEGVHEWQKDAMITADFVETHFGTRIITIPQTTPHEAYNHMQAFIDTLADDGLRWQLQQAIHGKGAFSRFRNALAQHPSQEQRWYTFKENQSRQRALEWLQQEAIEPLNPP